MKHILVAIDGSDYANKALDVAAKLAKSDDADVTLVHVASDAAPSKKEKQMIQVEYADELMRRVIWRQPKGTGSQTYVDALMAQHADTTDAVKAILGERLMSAAIKRLKEKGLDDVATMFESTGHDIAERIIEAANESNADTIVMGTRGMSDFRGAIIGSVSHKVAHLAACDVILVH